MTIASRWLRRAETALWALGISLLGVALGATSIRWSYQAREHRALFAAAPDVHAVAASESPTPNDLLRDPQPDSVAVLAGPVEPSAPAGPPSPAIAGQDDVKIADANLAPPPEEKLWSPVNAEPAALGRIEIPRLGLSAIIKNGADNKTLARAVGLLPGAARPGEVGNTVLAGHRDTFFRPLSGIRVDDRIRLLVPPDEYEYRVESLRVVSPDETSVLQSNGVEELTLVTCYPFRFIGPAPDRFIVSATRVR